MKYKFLTVVTNDVTRLGNFYKAVLHAELKGFDNDVYVELFIEDFVFCVESIHSVEKRAGAKFSSFTAGSSIYEFIVDNVDEEYARLKEIGVKPFGGPYDTPWGTRGFYFNDPDGNMACFYSEIGVANNT